ncbi:MT-A70 domain protein [Metarhizium robertsii]|uniref:Mt-a70 n=2 Tax=Metarhizium robertsii TaxID=568076 RepID=E9F2B8_METRA|nr:mt-a70 [Metarhizium robertsii ARSEF 23]EFY98207.1 mt-a70 [Metarhizium robertsii ARSEF 23]EXV01586.1 MT-A70 domain protein [Metarhizium robertsii]
MSDNGLIGTIAPGTRLMSGPPQDDAATASSVLFQSSDKTVVLLDVPRSLEEAQVLPGCRLLRRVYSDPPPTEPFPTPDPKRSRRRAGRRGRCDHDASGHDGGAAHDWPAQPPAAQIADLMTAAAVQSALQVMCDGYNGPFHLPRKQVPADIEAVNAPPPLPVQDARPLHGSIQDLRQVFADTAPVFKLVVLDPPWPNRSARRRSNKYATATNLDDIRALLTSIPISAHLASDGLVAVWITNKASIPELLTSPAGVFASWGVELVAEWTWLKITAAGEPLYDVESVWRKPWEKILIAKPIGVPAPPGLKAKVIVAAPDVHSRKPNLRLLFQDVLGQQDYAGLEIFARNLTAGWWSWGDQVLHFQGQQYWEQSC